MLSDETIKTSFEGLEPTDQYNKFKFVIKIEATDAEFNTWVLDYINNKTTVRPKEYDAVVNMLRDRLNIAKN